MRFGLTKALVATLMITSTLGLGINPAAAAADETARIEITGRGWGHGRGMGQYGAYGYAQNHGWSSAQILDHFYGGTEAGQAPANGEVDPAAIRVELRYMRGFSTTVSLGEGSILLRGMGGEDLGQISNGAVRLTYQSGQFWVSYATECDGSYTTVGAIAGHSTVRLLADSSAEGADGLLSVCRSGDAQNWYDGEVRAVIHDGIQRTVNALPIDQYLRGVVPKESPSSWPLAALEAQSVAARSYALAGDTRQQPYADTCETTLCQVYGGRFAQTSSGSFAIQSNERTDIAIAATAGLVRLTPAGTVARTEFSSSTGGYTTGDAFTNVADEGDAIEANPNRNWKVSVDVLALEAKFGKGRLLDLVVTERTGLGPDGGRVAEIDFRFEDGTVTQTGWKARTTLGLKSDWFVLGEIDRFNADEVSNFVDSAYLAFTGLPANSSDRSSWTTHLSSHPRSDLTNQLAYSEAYAGAMIDGLYQRALGRKADVDGKQYWLDQLAQGSRIDYVGVLFFGSNEYYNEAGSAEAYVTRLYSELLTRGPETKGLNYWSDLLDAGIARADDVAAGFYIAEESRNLRAEALFEKFFGTSPSSAELATWSARLLEVDDIGLSAEMAATDKYYTKVNQR